MEVEKLQNIKDMVFKIMSENVQTRNSDKFLILEVLRGMGFKIYIDYKQLKNMPSFESITRARRFIQNTKGVLLSSKQIDEQRKKNEQNYKEVFR